MHDRHPDAHPTVNSSAAPSPASPVWPPDDCHLFITTLGSPSNSDHHCFLMADALREMVVHGQEESDHEVGGVLLGAFVAHGRHRGTWVQEIMPAFCTDASLVHVTFTHETWNDIHRRLAEYPETPRIVGWYHTHPGFGPFYSAYDRFIHEHFFADPGHIGLVLDPRNRTLSLYGWSAGQLQRARGLYLCQPASEGAMHPDPACGVTYIADASAKVPTWLNRLLRRRNDSGDRPSE